MTPSTEHEVHEFIGETRADVSTLKQGQRDLWDAVTQSRTDSATAHGELRKLVHGIAEEVAGMRVKIAVAAALASMVGAAIAGLIVKLA